MQGDQKDKIEALMDKVLNKEIHGVFELEDKALGDPEFSTTTVWGHVSLDHNCEEVVAPVTGDVDLFAVMMPMSELLKRSNLAGRQPD